MIIKYQKGDRITIPKGCKAQIQGNEIYFVEDYRNPDFRDGDIIIDIDTVSANGFAIAILKETFNGGQFYDYASIDYDCGFHCNDSELWDTDPTGWRLATDAEKQILFREMKKHGLRWNALKKQVEPLPQTPTRK